MLKILLARLKQGYRTQPFPADPSLLPERYLGLPRLDQQITKEDCQKGIDVCPVEAIDWKNNKLYFDMGKCIFCGECQKVCHGINFSREYSLATFKRSDLVISNQFCQQEKIIQKKIKHIFGKSLKLRQVSAGGCNACESDINVLNTLSFDLGRFGIQLVASPRHADGLIVTGAVTNNMRLALEKAYNAIPAPKIVIAVGACAISGGPYANHEQVNNGLDSIMPVDVYVPGCPPHPLTILAGILKFMKAF